MSGPIASSYSSQLESGCLEPNDAQQEALTELDRLGTELEDCSPSRIGFLLRIGRSRPPMPKGIYLHGGVGRGKTMLMDLFYEAVRFAPKRRTHFHEFMADVHDRITEARKSVDGDPIPHVAGQLAQEAKLLCFDELHVTDIADAMILGRLFDVLFARNVVVVATSNAMPNELYKNGLNRQLFEPFIALIESHMMVKELAADKDFRREKIGGRPLYFAPADAAARLELDDHWQRLIGGQDALPVALPVKGRLVEVPLAAMGAARFSFDDLCAQPLGAVDYLHIAHAFHTIVIDDIPVLTPEKRNEARRFINLVDSLYDNGVCLIASAEAEPDALYDKGDGADLFQRTASRLTEMRSQDYLMLRNMRADRVREPA